MRWWAPFRNEPKLIDLHQAGAILGVSARTVRRKVAAGELPGYKLGPRCLRVKLDDVLAMIDAKLVSVARPTGQRRATPGTGLAEGEAEVPAELEREPEAAELEGEAEFALEREPAEEREAAAEEATVAEPEAVAAPGQRRGLADHRPGGGRGRTGRRSKGE